MSGSGTHEDPWQLTTAPGTSAYTMWRDEESAQRTLPAIIQAVTATPVHSWAAVPPRVVRLDELS